MPKTPAEVEALAKELSGIRDRERRRLDLIHSYLRDDPDDHRLGRFSLPAGTPHDVIRLARLSRVNMLKYIVNARVQHMYVDGFQTTDQADNLEQWNIWQRNKMDARQIGVHRAAMSFGAGYVTVLPGRPVPVMRGVSPRDMSVAYGDDDEWPVAALQKLRGKRWRIIDRETMYWLNGDDGALKFDAVADQPHGARVDDEPVCPVVRFRDTDDLDNPVVGIVEPYLLLQDQINITSFGLQVAQHYGAFRQRYVLGWLAESEEEALKTGASQFMMFEDEDVQVGEFAQTDLRGYIESREATMRHLATVSQTPVHELLGQFVNLSAEALEAARASHQSAGDENRVMAGESWEQALNLAGSMAGIPPDMSASVRWRDTRVRSLAEAAQALGALASDLGVPPRELWHRIPGVPQHEVEQWKAAADDADPFADLSGVLQQQASGSAAVTDADDLKKRFDALGVAIRAGVDPADAARRVGLEGVTFTGAVPVSLRIPERDAAQLEEA